MAIQANDECGNPRRRAEGDEGTQVYVNEDRERDHPRTAGGPRGYNHGAGRGPRPLHGGTQTPSRPTDLR